MHEARGLTSYALKSAMISGLAGSMKFTPTKAPSGADLKAEGPKDRSAYNRKGWRSLLPYQQAARDQLMGGDK